MCLAAIQFVAIAWFNYRHVYGALDMDAAMGIRQNIEQWKHGLFLEDFIFATTLSNDYVSFWAVPFYFLSGNLNLAMMLSQCLTYFIIVLILWDICSGLELTIDQYLFSVILIFTPYSLDVLEWAYLLFISVGYYAYRVIALLLLFDLLTQFFFRKNSAAAARIEIIRSEFFSRCCFYKLDFFKHNVLICQNFISL